MPQLALAAVSTFMTVTSAGGLAGFSYLGLAAGMQSALAHFAVRAALGYALNALTPKGAPASRGYQNVNQLGAALPHQVIYGETRIGGSIFYQTTNGGGSNLHRCIAFAGHEIDSYQAIYLNDEEVTLDANGNVTYPNKYANKVRIKKYLGTADQLADPDLVNEVIEWTEKHRARGVAYLYVRFSGASNFNNGAPTVTAKIRGKKVYDTRTSTTAWSDNPALVMRDYLLSEYGLEEITANIDEDRFEAAADLCDATVPGGKTYTCNGAFLLDSSPEDIIRNLLSSMGGIFWNYGGKWAVLAAEYRTPAITLTEDDLRGELQVATRHSRRDNFNAVRGQYKGPETNYQPDDYREVTSGKYLDEDSNIRAANELPLLFTDSEIMAQRIARRYLRRNRLQVTVSGAFGLRALDLTIGDNVKLTIDHLGWNEKVFEVVDWRMGVKDLDIHVTMILREMDEVVFTGVVEVLQDESLNTLTDESNNSLEAIVA